MATKTAVSVATESDDGYNSLEAMIRDRIAGCREPLFTTDVEGLFSVYLDNIPENRQHYNCHCCRRFVELYGGLVTINDEGVTNSLLWSIGPPDFFGKAFAEMWVRSKESKVNGVFLSSAKVWGTPQTGGWTHLSGVPATVYHERTKTAFQAMAEKKEDYGILSHGLADYPLNVVQEAVRVLKADALSRSEKTLGVAEWLLNLHEVIKNVRGPKRNNLIWKAVATAPPGFCHVRSTMISTLLDDIVSGLSFDVISRRWAEKMHPLQYQRPTAPPKSGAIEAAEKLFEQTGAAKSLERRYATLDDVMAKLWMPTPIEEKLSEKVGGVFGHLKAKSNEVKPLELPAKTMTWEKFRDTVLPTAKTMELKAPSRGGYFGLLTAVHADAPAIIQWDGLNGHDRNPVSWYFYTNGSLASRWKLDAGSWIPVTAVFLDPSKWQKPDQFKHQGDRVMFSLQGSIESEPKQLCLFPEILKSEYHGIRSVIEAHSNRMVPVGAELGTANGLAFQKERGQPIHLRVRSADGTADYTIDRWE